MFVRSGRGNIRRRINRLNDGFVRCFGHRFIKAAHRGFNGRLVAIATAAAPLMTPFVFRGFHVARQGFGYVGVRLPAATFPRSVPGTTGFGLRLRHHIAPLFRIRCHKRFPPCDKFRRHVSQKRAQQHEVVRCPIFRMINERKGILPRTAFKPQLHHPDHLHVGDEPVLNRQPTALRRNHVVGRGKKCVRTRHFAFGFVVFPTLHDLRPQKRAEHEGGGNLLTHGNAFIRTL